MTNKKRSNHMLKNLNTEYDKWFNQDKKDDNRYDYLEES